MTCVHFISLITTLKVIIIINNKRSYLAKDKCQRNKYHYASTFLVNFWFQWNYCYYWLVHNLLVTSFCKVIFIKLITHKHLANDGLMILLSLMTLSIPTYGSLKDFL